MCPVRKKENWKNYGIAAAVVVAVVVVDVAVVGHRCRGDSAAT